MKSYLLLLLATLLILLIGVVGLIIRKERERSLIKDETRLVGKRIRGTNFVAKGTLQTHAGNSKK